MQERLRNDFALGSIVNFLGYVAYNRGEHDAARGYYRQAAALLAAAGEPGAELNPLANLAVLDVEAGRIATAVDTFERILAVLPAEKQERYRSDTLFNLGTSYRRLGYTDQALQTFTSALAIQVRDEDTQGRGRSLRGIGDTYYGLGELETAAEYLEQALALAVETNDGRPQFAIHRVLGNIAALEGDYTKALARHETAMRFVTSATDRAYLELLIARDLINLGRAAEAADLAAAASATAETAGSDRLTATTLHELSGAPKRGRGLRSRRLRPPSSSARPVCIRLWGSNRSTRPCCTALPSSRAIAAISRRQAPMEPRPSPPPNACASAWPIPSCAPRPRRHDAATTRRRSTR